MNGMKVTQPATYDDALWLSTHANQAEIDEAAAVGFPDILTALKVSIRNSVESFSLKTPDGELLGLFGITEYSHPTVKIACPWMIPTRLGSTKRKTLMKLSRGMVHHWRKRYDVLFNFVDARHDKAIALLEWLGFTVLEREVDPGNGHALRLFEMGGSE